MCFLNVATNQRQRLCCVVFAIVYNMTASMFSLFFIYFEWSTTNHLKSLISEIRAHWVQSDSIICRRRPLHSVGLGVEYERSQGKYHMRSLETCLHGFANVVKIYHFDAASVIKWAHIFTLEVRSLNSASLLTGCGQVSGIPSLSFSFLLYKKVVALSSQRCWED